MINGSAATYIEGRTNLEHFQNFGGKKFVHFVHLTKKVVHKNQKFSRCSASQWKY